MRLSDGMLTLDTNSNLKELKQVLLWEPAIEPLKKII